VGLLLQLLLGGQCVLSQRHLLPCRGLMVPSSKCSRQMSSCHLVSVQVAVQQHTRPLLWWERVGLAGIPRQLRLWACTGQVKPLLLP
jgi:hypothetical protein